MTAASLVVLTVTLIFGMAGPHLSRLLPPAAATKLLVPASLLIAASLGWVFVAVSFTWIAQLGPVSRYGAWSPDQIRAITPIPTIVAVVSGLLALGAASRSLLVAVRRLVAMRVVRRGFRHLGAPGSLVVVEADRPDAFATPGADGRIVITTGLLRALTVEERRALLAHETSHLVHQHAWWMLAMDCAAGANPLLTPTARAVEHAIERWADEDAAHAVNDRRLVARTLARTALLTRAAGGGALKVPPSGRLAAAGGDVPNRVRALLAPAPRPRLLPLAALAVLLVTGTIGAATVQNRSDQLLDQAGVRPISTHQVPHHHRWL